MMRRLLHTSVTSITSPKVRFGTALVRPSNEHQHSPKWLAGRPQHWYHLPRAIGGLQPPLKALTGRHSQHAVGAATKHDEAVQRRYPRRARRLRRRPRVVGIEREGWQRVAVVARRRSKSSAPAHARGSHVASARLAA